MTEQDGGSRRSGVEDGSLLAALPAADREAVLDGAAPVVVRAGNWLFRQGSPADAVYLVEAGRLEVLHEPGDGDAPRLLRVVGPGGVLGEIGLLTGLPRTASVRARRDSHLLRLDAGVLQAQVRRSPHLALALLRAMGLRLADPRGGERSDGPLVRVLALTAVGDAGSARRLSADVVIALRALRPAVRAVLVTEEDATAEVADHGSAGNGPSGEAFRSHARLLDRWERSADVVVLVAGAVGGIDPHARTWTDFCLRSADRTLVVVTGHDDVGAAPRVAEGLGACGSGPPDLCFLDLAEPASIGGWLDALAPRAHHLVRSGAAAAETVGRMTRRVHGRSVGLVLSGGGARGFAHLGVVSALRSAGVRIDRVGGCSMGAIMGALVAAGHSDEALVEAGRRYFVNGRPLSDYTVPRTALLQGRRMASLLHEALGPGSIEHLPVPFFCVSADLVRAEPVVHRRGPVWEAVLASASIPGLLPPRAVGGRLLVDGGVLNNLPIDVMADEAEGPVVAVDVMRPFGSRPAPDMRTRRVPGWGRRGKSDDGEPARPPIAEVLARATVLGSWRAAERNRERAALTITVPDDGTGLLEWQRLDALVAAGRAAAEAALSGDAAGFLLPASV